MKKSVKIIFIIIICTSIVSYLVFRISNGKNQDDFSIAFESSSINDHLEPYLKSKFYSVSIRSYENNTIQGDIYDTSSNGNLFVTKALFKYNINDNTFDIFEYNTSERILYYYISDKNIYATIIEDTNLRDELFEWQIVSYSLDFKDKTILKTGVVVSPFDVPNFYYDSNNDNIFTVVLSEEIDNNKRIQTFEILYLFNNSITKLIDYNGIYNENSGEMPCGMMDIHVENEELIYCMTDFLNYQTIYSFNMLTKNTKELYKNDLRENFVINSYRKKNDNLLISKYNLNESDKGELEYVDLKTNSNQKISSDVYYTRNQFIKNILLFHKSEKWEYYDINDNKIKVAKIVNHKNTYFYPFYINVSDDKIMILSDNNELFIGEIY